MDDLATLHVLGVKLVLLVSVRLQVDLRLRLGLKKKGKRVRGLRVTGAVELAAALIALHRSVLLTSCLSLLYFAMLGCSCSRYKWNVESHDRGSKLPFRRDNEGLEVEVQCDLGEGKRRGVTPASNSAQQAQERRQIGARTDMRVLSA